MGRFRQDALARLAPVLPRVSLEFDGRIGEVAALKFLQRVPLAVYERVHGIDEHGARRSDVRRPFADYGVVYRNQIRQALPRPGAGGDDERLAFQCEVYRLALMPIQPQVFAEEPRRFGRNDAVSRHLAERVVHLEGGVDLQRGGRPEVAGGEPLLDELVYPRIRYVDEASRVVAVLAHDGVAQPEDV